MVEAGEENGECLDPDRDRGAIRPPSYSRGPPRRTGSVVWVVEGTEKVQLAMVRALRRGKRLKSLSS